MHLNEPPVARRAATLIAALRARGVTVTAEAEVLRICSRRGTLTDADRAAIATQKAAILALLRTEGKDSSAPGASGLCGNANWCWQPDWPRAGVGRWLCGVCMAQPAPSLASLAAALAPEDHRRLRIEAANGDTLALAVLRALDGPDPGAGAEG